MSIRIGYGYDVHQLQEGRKLILGGVHVPFHLGLKGHSDADVLLHSVTDSILGAAALGDIGKHFPDTDPAYKDADSYLLLCDAFALVKKAGYTIGNIDATIIAERPKLQPYIDSMRARIAEACECEIERVSVKATTHEKLGALGELKGIAAHSVSLIEQRS